MQVTQEWYGDRGRLGGGQARGVRVGKEWHCPDAEEAEISGSLWRRASCR